jgi:hypothetical protein
VNEVPKGGREGTPHVTHTAVRSKEMEIYFRQTETKRMNQTKLEPWAHGHREFHKHRGDHD